MDLRILSHTTTSFFVYRWFAAGPISIVCLKLKQKKGSNSAGTYVSSAVILSSNTDKDLLRIPIEQGSEVGVNVEVELDKVLDVSIHMPCCFSANEGELVENEVARGFVVG